MYVYLKSGPQLWTVGFYDPSGTWNAAGDKEEEEAAAKLAARLNGMNDQYLDEIEELAERLLNGRDYLMGIGDYVFNLPECFEAFGFGADGRLPQRVSNSRNIL